LELNRLIGKNKFDLQDSTTEMVKTREEIRKLKLLQRNNDEQLEEIKKENELLKSQIEVLNAQINSHHDQDSALMNIVESRVKEFRVNQILFQIYNYFVSILFFKANHRGQR
jgi:hypothetical protein